MQWIMFEKLDGLHVPCGLLEWTLIYNIQPNCHTNPLSHLLHIMGLARDLDQECMAKSNTVLTVLLFIGKEITLTCNKDPTTLE